MNYVIKVAKTVDEAVSEALKELNITKDEAKIEIIEEASKGFLGLIGTKNATVKVSKITDTKDILAEIFNEKPESEKSQKEAKVISNEFENNSNASVDLLINKSVEETNNNISIDDITKEFISKLMKVLDIDYDLNIKKEKNVLYVEILGNEAELGIVIGKRGVTLDAIQYILSLIINKNSKEFIRVVVDSSGYRKKRESTLQDLARKMGAKALKTSRSIRLEPMNSQERKIIHEALQDYEGVFTHSEGKEPYRRVVIQKEREY